MPLVLPASFAGKTVACSRCGHAVLVSDAAGAATVSQPVLPPHLAAGRGSPLFPPPPPEQETPAANAQHAVAVARNVELVEKDEPEDVPRKRSWLVSGCLMLLV